MRGRLHETVYIILIEEPTVFMFIGKRGEMEAYRVQVPIKRGSDSRRTPH